MIRFWRLNIAGGIICFFSSLFFYSLLAYALTPQEILEKIDKIRAPDKTFAFDVTATVHKEGEEDLQAELLVRVKDLKKSLVVFKSPPDSRGRVILMVEDNLWIYIPGTRNPLRISPQQHAMSRISNADLARVVYSLDYEATAMEEANWEGHPAIKLNLQAKTKGAAYKMIDFLIEKETLRPIKADFYAVSGKLLKTAYYKEYKTILGDERPTILEIHDGIKTSEITTLHYQNIRKEETPEAHFQKGFMERAAP